MLTLVSCLMACLALGMACVAALMRLANRQICRQKDSLSEYYFDVPRRPSNPKLVDAILSSLDKWSLYPLAWLVCLTIVCAAAYEYRAQYPDTYCNIYKTVCATMQDGINILLPPAVAAVVIFASFKKPYYILFSIYDVIKRYKIYGHMIAATVAWCVTIVLQVVSHIFPVVTTGVNAILFYSTMFLCQVACLLSCLLVLSKSFRIVLSDKKSELKILDTLYYEASFEEYYMRCIDLSDNADLGAIHDHCIEQLERKTRRAKRQLTKCMKLSRVEFWDSVSRRPMPSIRLVAVPIILFAFLVLSLGAVIGIGLCYIDGLRYAFFQYHWLAAGISLAAFGLTVILFCKVPCLSKMLRAWVYGRWGYRFLDTCGTPKAYISCYPALPIAITKWLRALLTVIALFRIECKSNCQKELLDALDQRLRTTRHDKPEHYAFTLAIELCKRLDPQEEKAKAAKSGRQDKLLESWVDAIWVDVWRDEAWYKSNSEASEKGKQNKDQPKKAKKKTENAQKKQEKKREKQKKLQKKGQKEATPEKLCRR